VPSLVLGISTAGPVEVALAGAGHDVAAASDKGALESLAGLLAHALHKANSTVEDIALIGVCTGPGSFTGLRIGVAFAKSLAQTRGVPIAGISAYDISAFQIQSFPIVSVVRGKRDYYYARLRANGESEPRFIQGPREFIELSAADLGVGGVPARIAGPDFSIAKPGDVARAAAQLACQAQERGDDLRWTNIAIDYGQRPNAVVNWEKRHGADEEGPPL
jgi:tRNA threonylcarbamoyl adenosine modification protein YeaZ